MKKRPRGTGGLFKPKHSNKWWLKYSVNGKARYESSGTDNKTKAQTMLTERLSRINAGIAVTPKMGKVSFDDAAKDLQNDFEINARKSKDEVDRRLKKHLTPYFEGWRLANITTTDVRAFTAKRLADIIVTKKAVLDAKGNIIQPEVRKPVSNAEVNRELQILKRMFSLAIAAGKVMAKPHIPMLKENNVRKGFFEPAQFTAVVRHLPEFLRPVVEFANLTGWRIDSEVLPLEWSRVDFKADTITLDAGTTKNGEARLFPMTAALRRLLEAQDRKRKALAKAGTIVPWVFWRMKAKGRRGPKSPHRIVRFNKVWRNACVAAGCPGRIPHDLRRTAVRSFVRAGIPERVAMGLTGHKTRSVFERYNIVSEGDLKDAARRLDVMTATMEEVAR